MNRAPRPLMLLALAGLAVASCTATPPQEPQPTSPAPEASATASPDAEPALGADASAAPDERVPSWAAGLSRAGTPVGELEVNGLHVEFRYLDVLPAERAQEVSASDGNFTLYEAGDPIHHLNVIVTNPSEETIVAGGGTGDMVSLFPADWGYLNAPTGPAIPWDYKDERGLVASAIAEVADDHRYPIAPGEGFSFTTSTHADAVEARVVWRDPGDWVNQHEGALQITLG